MPLNADLLLNYQTPVVEFTLTDKDVMLYALSIGMSEDPLDPVELAYTYEKGLKVFPMMAVVTGNGEDWLARPEFGVTYTMIVHGSQRLEVFAEPELGKVLVARDIITHLEDKGDKGAIVTTTREIHDKASGKLLSRAEGGVFCRADGGFGQVTPPPRSFRPVPDRAPDLNAKIATRPNMALLYRLNHDRNPLHADPQVAVESGFPRPISHGLGSYGATGLALWRLFPGRELVSIETRFSKPVYPGETITVDVWDEGEEVAFRARVAARDAVVLDMGRARLV